MNKKQLFTLLTLFLLIASLAFIQKSFTSTYDNNTTIPITTSSLSLVDTVRITQKDVHTILQKQGTQWVLTSPSASNADSKKVEDLLGRVKLLTKAEEVTRNKEKWDLYGVGETGLHIELLEHNKKVFGYILGKVSEDYASVYIRQDEDTTVYKSKGILRDEFTAESAFFKSKELTNFSEKDIAEIIIKKGTKKISLLYNGTTWESTPKSKENAPINSIVSLLSHLQLDSFTQTGPQAEDIQTNPTYKVFLSRSNKDLKSTIIYLQKDNSTLYGCIEGSSEVFILDVNTASMLDKLFL